MLSFLNGLIFQTYIFKNTIERKTFEPISSHWMTFARPAEKGMLCEWISRAPYRSPSDRRRPHLHPHPMPRSVVGAAESPLKTTVRFWWLWRHSRSMSRGDYGPAAPILYPRGSLKSPTAALFVLLPFATHNFQ